MAARESQHHVVDFFSADSTNRGEVFERELPPLQQTLKPPPPVALSLRTRESSALALKHIFDQIYSSAESNPNKNNSANIRANERRDSSDFQAFNRDGSNAAFQGGRNHEVSPGWQAKNFPEEHRTYLQESESSFAKVKHQSFPMHDLVLGGSTPAPPSGQIGHLPLQQTSLPQVVTRLSPLSPLIRQPTAQLTIFYSGTVNVYDDVPADKANAIMLLAGSGNSSSMIKSGEGDKQCAPTMLKSPPSPPLHMGPAATVLEGSTGAIAAPASIGKAMSFNMPPASNIVNNTLTNTLSSPSNASPTHSLVMEPKPQSVPKRSHAGIELPHARKASLARFLEKRKDRVIVKQQHAEGTHDEKGEISREERPPSPKKPYLTGLSSPTIKQ